jgi:hypothetical protein
MTASHDSLLELFLELRQSRPPIYLADEFGHWKEAIGQVLAAVHSPSQRWAMMILVASDINASTPGPWSDRAFMELEEAVHRAVGVRV